MCNHEKIIYSKKDYECLLKVVHPNNDIYGVKIIYDYNGLHSWHDEIFFKTDICPLCGLDIEQACKELYYY